MATLCNMKSRTRHLAFLPFLRQRELQVALRLFPTARADRVAPRVLDIGAGTGVQALALQNSGFEVKAIDLADSPYADERVFPVADYDGRRIPFEDDSFDVVFSSHVLEHVKDLDAFLVEIKRVLRPGGAAIHLIPTASCRAWSMAAHYLWATSRVLDAVVSHAMSRAKKTSSETPRMPRSSREWASTLFAPRHGERGAAANEFFYYRRRWWVERFARSGFRTTCIESSGVFATMSNALAARLSLETRERLALLLGSSSWIYKIELGLDSK
jgi:SAM-dependent methyltransferase